MPPHASYVSPTGRSPLQTQDMMETGPGEEGLVIATIREYQLHPPSFWVKYNNKSISAVDKKKGSNVESVCI